MTDKNEGPCRAQRPYVFACTSYRIQDTLLTPSAEGIFAVPHVSIFESLVSCSAKCAQELGKMKEASVLREVFGGILGLLNEMVIKLASPVDLGWRPAEWLEILLQSINYEVRLAFSYPDSSYIDPLS